MMLALFMMLFCVRDTFSQAISGRRVLIQEALGGVSTGAWRAGGKELLLVDAVGGRVVSISPDSGRLTRVDLELGPNADSAHNPTRIQSLPDGYAFELANGNIVITDEELKEIKRDLSALSNASKSGIEGEIFAVSSGFFNWVISGDFLHAFGDINLTKAGAGGDEMPSWISGFLAFDLNRPGHFDYSKDLFASTTDPARVFYRLGNPMFTAGGGNVYTLVMDESPYLARIDDEQMVSFAQLEEYCGARPEIGKPAEIQETLMHARRVLEGSDWPVGVYHQENLVFALCRRGAHNKPGFIVLAFDAAGSLVSISPVPTTAKNITAIPGEKYWAFVEKGAVRSISTDVGKRPYMQIESALFVPSSYFSFEINVSSIQSSGFVWPRWGNRVLTILEAIWQEREWMFSGIGGVLLTLWLTGLRRTS